MARATSGLGQFRGKVGSVVFRVSQGQQIASAYQPAVKNPKSNTQTAQRNKMYLASQLSKLVPREDIIGLAPTKSVRDRRSLFIQNILDNATSSYDGEVFETKLNFAKLALSNGQYLQGVGVAWDSQTSTLSIGVDKNLIDENTYNRLALKLCMFDVINGEYVAYKSSWLDMPSYSEETQDGFISMNVVLTTPPQRVAYVIPILLKDNVRYSREKKTLVQFAFDSVGEFVVEGEYAISSAVLEWKHSIPIYASIGGVVVPPAGDGDEVVNPDGPSFPNLG